MAHKKPNLLIVGIDIGMTQTGIAYFWHPRPVKVVQNWPRIGDRLSSAIDNKVPTVLQYSSGDLHGRTNLEGWGFECDLSQPRVEWFKRYLDPDVLRDFQESKGENAWVADDIERFYIDYLKTLYNWLKWKLTNQRATEWRHAKIEFLFSVPATWKSPAIEKFKQYILKAGFGKGGVDHSIETSLTEPQAAAVYTVTESDQEFEYDDIMMVIDAGGGTTDICILQMTGTPNLPSFGEMIPVHGINIGATNIDDSFERLVREKLKRSGLNVPSNTTREMVHSVDYEAEKEAFGVLNHPKEFIYIRVPPFAPNFTVNAAGIREGRMIFTYFEFKALFDPQVLAIENAVRYQLGQFEQFHPHKQIKYLVLSGGLGSSAYLRNQLSTRLMGDPKFIHPRALEMKCIVSDDPQLAVMKGLVIDRRRRLETGRPVLASRCCRVSYGILSAQLYDPAYHRDEEFEIDPVDGKKVARNMIIWIIKKGDKIVPDELINLPIWTKNYEPGETSRIIEDHIVISHADPRRLPKSLLDNDVEKLYTITADFSAVKDHELKSAFREPSKLKPWKRQGDPYFVLEHQMKVLIGAADMTVQSWFKGTRYDNDQSLVLQWEDREHKQKNK